jgi:hypothetical protein
MNQRLVYFLPKALQWGLLAGLTATLAFAQTRHREMYPTRVYLNRRTGVRLSYDSSE